VRVVIHRSGRIISASIEQRSGNAALDRSVQRALDKVRMIKPFPEGSLDQQRTFNIKFVPKFKRSIG
jgi:TonB family protein